MSFLVDCVISVSDSCQMQLIAEARYVVQLGNCDSCLAISLCLQYYHSRLLEVSTPLLEINDIGALMFWDVTCSNHIETLPERPFELGCLRELDLSRNKIKVIPERLLTKCPNLQQLHISKNELGTSNTVFFVLQISLIPFSISIEVLPSGEVASSLNELTHLTLAHNGIGVTGFPDFVLNLKL